MLYFVPSNKRLRVAHGAIIAPTTRHGAGSVAGRQWIADNGAFSKSYSEARFYAFLGRMLEYRETCLMAVAPDVVGDAVATLGMYGGHRERIKALGYPVGYVAQDGAEDYAIPDCEGVFIGGTTEWKMGPGALLVIRRAQALGLWVHVGRVNTKGRYIYFQMVGANSCDGTCIVYGPDVNGPKIEGWVSQPALFTLEG